MRRAIQLGADYLVRQCGADGRFVYRINLNPKVRMPPAYNVLRHAGTLYALAQVQQRWPNDQRLAALKRCARYLREQHVAPLPGHPDKLAVWSEPIAEGLNEAKLGGAGLALLALTLLERLAPGSTPEALLDGLARFVGYLQKPDGSFYSKYHNDHRRRSDAWTSLYYPGEAAFGLLEWHALKGRPRAQQTARAALLYLAHSRRGRSRVPADHWALLASSALLRQGGDALPAPTRQALEAHMAQLCRHIVEAAPEHEANAVQRGGLTAGGFTTPTATRLEGLSAALPLLDKLPQQRSLARRMRPLIARGNAFLLRAQIRAGQWRGAVPRVVAPTAKKRSTEVRIDYVQHAVSAWLGHLGPRLDGPDAQRSLWAPDH